MMPNELLEEVNSLAYAIFLIAESVENKYLKLKLERQAVDLLEFYFSGKKGEFLEKSAIIRSLVILAANLNYVTEKNKEAIIDKLQDFEYVVLPKDSREVRVEDVLARTEEYEMEDEELNYSDKQQILSFTGDESEELEEEAKEDKKEDKEIVEDEEEFGKDEVEVRQSDSSESLISSEKKKTKADERRDKVMEVVRREGICFLRDLSSYFPDFSERTLRYDLERLISEGKVEKIGSSGPGTFYRNLG